jgi:hypothetical protein
MKSNSMQLRKGYTQCIVCTAPHPIGAHLLGRNVRYKNYNPADKANLRPLCDKCHRSYDKNTSPIARMKWWEERGFYSIVQRIAWLVSNETD